MLWDKIKRKLILKFFLYELERNNQKPPNNPDSRNVIQLSSPEDKFKALVENTNDVLWEADLELRCTYVTPNIINHLGYTPEEMIGKTPYDHMDKEEAERVFQIVLDSIEAGEGVMNVMCTLIHKNGSPVITETSTKLIFNDKGKLLGFRGIDRNVTKRKREKDLSDALNHINTLLNSTLYLNKIMSSVAGESLKAVNSDTCIIMLKENDIWTTKEVAGRFDSRTEELLKKGNGIYESLEKLDETPVAMNTGNNEAGVSLISSFGHVSIFIAPLSVRGKAVGCLVFICYDKIHIASDYELDFFDKLRASISLAMENSRLYEEQKAISDTLQESFLTIPKSMKGINFSYEYASATVYTSVGGDFIDIFRINKDVIGIIVGDISGNGLLAANLTTLVKNSIKAYAFYEKSPAAVLKKTNKAVLSTRQIQMFATVFYAVLTPSTGELTYCCAGHPAPILKRRTLDTVTIAPNSPSVGAFNEAIYTDSKFIMNAGDILVIYTDGITEARNGKDFYGEKRLIKFVRDLNFINLNKIPKLILREALDYSEGKTLDDIAILAVSLEVEDGDAGEQGC